MTNLERLLDPDQLMLYPSDFTRFNLIYEEALECFNNSRVVQELYVVQYRSKGGQLFFSFVPPRCISDEGPYHLRETFVPW